MSAVPADSASLERFPGTGVLAMNPSLATAHHSSLATHSALFTSHCPTRSPSDNSPQPPAAGNTAAAHY